MSKRFYKSKPVVIEAIKYTGSRKNTEELLEFCNVVTFNASGVPYILTLEGNMRVSEGDYVIKGLKGEFYPCKPDVFHQKYEAL